MTAVLDRIPVERITSEARSVHVGRGVLALLALIPFLIGWLTGQAVTAVVWVGFAVKAGWLEARSPSPKVDGG